LGVQVRLQKYLAEAGVESRRACERFILTGRVAVNGVRVTELGTRVDPAADEVAVDGQPVRLGRRLYVALNKPPGYLCSRRDASDRLLVTELLPSEWRNLYPVGRLDKDSEGLLFLTNDGGFCLRMTHPRFGIRKQYLATVPERLESMCLVRLVSGIRDRGEWLRASKARLLACSNSRSVVEIELTEGKNREVRRLFAALGLEVERLQRTRIGPIKLGELRRGKWRMLSSAELDALQKAAEAAVEARRARDGPPRPGEG
jgi:pseudouridine synthase